VTGPFYSSPRLYLFQAKAAATSYLRDNNLIIYSTGIGKTHIAMMTSALLAEDGLIDHILVVCEANKVTEWIGDYRTYCNFERVEGYLGSNRLQLLVDPPDVLVTTYETSRNDMAQKRPGKPRALDSGPLTGVFQNRRVLVIYDEASRLKNRSSGIYRHHEHFLGQMRKHGEVRTMALTATPVESSPENVFNIARLLDPTACSVAEFERLYVKGGRDLYGNAFGYHHIGDHDRVWPGEPTLYERIAHLVQVKDKFDLDVIDEFPHQVETFEWVELPAATKKVYTSLVKTDEQFGGGGLMALRQFACHPASLLTSQSDLAVWAQQNLGEIIAKLAAPKLDALLHHLDRLVREEGRKVVVFTFFGQSVLPLIVGALTKAGYSVAQCHGQQSAQERDDERTRFRSGPAQVYVSSDAGSRGVNLPEASVVINYEMPSLHAIYEQRINRIHRIDSEQESVLALTLISRGTVEEALAQVAMERNAWFDTFVSATEAAGVSVQRPTAELRRSLMAEAIRQPVTEEPQG